MPTCGTAPTATGMKLYEAFRGWTLAWRAATAALLLGFEKSLLGYLIHFDPIHPSDVDRFVHTARHLGFWFLVTFGAAFALLACSSDDPRLPQINVAARGTGWRPRWLAVHGLSLIPLALLTSSLYGDRKLPLPTAVTAVLWLIVAAWAGASLFAALAPWEAWREAARALAGTGLAAAAIGVGAAFAMNWSQTLWDPATRITFAAVKRVLLPVVPGLQSDPFTHVLATGHFAVQVNKECSGLEGAGLMLVFCGAWLLLFRRDYRFPRALIIVPAGLAVLFGLNVLRIAALVLIGDAGFPDVALYGFHSQAGWIAFIATACGIAYGSRRIAWLSRAAQGENTGTTGNPTAAYLLPFLAILAAGMLSRAASGTFETFYPLRLAAATLTLWHFRTGLSNLDWRFSWRGLAAGAAVFALWLAASRQLIPPAGMPARLSGMPPFWRATWIAARTGAAIITVPIAEELAYRGYLLRRIRSADFESVAYGAAGWPALIASSVIFGAAHGRLWPAGVAAGLTYGGMAMRTGRLGEAVAAHAATNALITAWVLAGGQWQLW